MIEDIGNLREKGANAPFFFNIVLNLLNFISLH